jgi:hypothetical protein
MIERAQITWRQLCSLFTLYAQNIIPASYILGVRQNFAILGDKSGVVAFRHLSTLGSILPSVFFLPVKSIYLVGGVTCTAVRGIEAAQCGIYPYSLHCNLASNHLL